MSVLWTQIQTCLKPAKARQGAVVVVVFVIVVVFVVVVFVVHVDNIHYFIIVTRTVDEVYVAFVLFFILHVVGSVVVVTVVVASKLYGLNATIIIFVFVFYCIILYCCCWQVVHVNTCKCRTVECVCGKRDPSSFKIDHACHICGRVCESSKHLEIHYRSHTGEKPEVKGEGSCVTWVEIVRAR